MFVFRIFIHVASARNTSHGCSFSFGMHSRFAGIFLGRNAPVSILAGVALAIAMFAAFGPFLTDPVLLYSSVGVIGRFGLAEGAPSIDPNIGSTSFALGARAAVDVLAGKLPLWNFYEGLGTPLLGEMQSAALFPPTWLLALPHGQALEHALLQVIGGVGAFLFFRKFGLSVTAALTGALLYELNGVFAWLRNAVFNPVAFLPWLLFTVEWVRANAALRLSFAERLPAICTGATAGALALYGGFPEQVYLYAYLVGIWAVFRLWGLTKAQLASTALDIGVMATLSGALSAPVLVAFVGFLQDSDWGRHGGEGFYGAHLGAPAFLQYFVPYVYGPIFAQSNPAVMGTWSGIGGYMGFLPLVAAIAALALADRRGSKVVLALWLVVCLGVTHGLPLLYQAFMGLPLMKTAATFRYLNPGWIFCGIFLSALFVDRVASLPRAAMTRVVNGALLMGLAVLAAAAAMAWPLLATLWRDTSSRYYLVAAVGCVTILAGLTLLFTRRLRGERLAIGLASLLVAEALLWFGIPFLSYPRAAHVDMGSIAYLRSHLGLQRVVETGGVGIGPNFGSYFGIATLNYSDIPVPSGTVAYLNRRLDSYAGTDFAWSVPPLDQAALGEREALLRERLPLYGNAGVKYLLAPADFFAHAAFAGLNEPGKRPHGLGPGQSLTISARRGQSDESSVTGVTVRVGTYGDTATGSLGVRLCVRQICTDGAADIARVRDGQPLAIALDKPIDIAAGEPFTITFKKIGDGNVVAVWLFDAAPAVDWERSATGVPDLGFVAHRSLLPVHQGPAMAIFEIPGTRSYFSAPGCDVAPQSRNRVDVRCATPSTLMRLELYMRGWRARINGAAASIGREDETFQTVALPAGQSQVTFSYRPPGIGMALTASVVAILFMVAAAWVYQRRQRAMRDHDNFQAGGAAKSSE